METAKGFYTEQKQEVEYDMGVAFLHLNEEEVDGGWLYDCLTVAVADEGEDALLDALRQRLVSEIGEYDSSTAVNSFTIQGVTLWLDRATRAALMRRFEAEKAGGVEQTTLWYGTYKFVMGVDTAIDLLNQIERYACQCFDTTAQHKADALKLGTMEEIMAYDYTTGYPDKVEIESE